MRTLTLHEKKLTLLLLAALAAGIHLLGIKFALGWDRENRRRLAGVKEELEEARFWISQQEEWRSRAEWLEKNFRPVPAENPAPALQKMLQGAASSAGLKVEEQRPPAPKPGERFVLYSNKMKLSGSLEQFLKWLVAVYQPDKGIAVTSLSLKIGPEPPKMAGEVEVSQFFRPNNP
jgi:hypothetical protein